MARKLSSIEGVDLRGKLVQLHQRLFDKGFKAEDALFLCVDGFGCSPCAMGRKVFGKFQSDGLESVILRSDIEFLVEEVEDGETA